MAAEHMDPTWPDKAMFSAILLILAGFVGIVFQLSRTYLTLDYNELPAIFTDDIPYYTLSLCIVTLVSGILSLRYQAALFAYVGAVMGILSLGVFGLVPALSILAIAFMVKSHLEGEETRFDGRELHSAMWPDKAMASSLFMVVVGGIALTQAVLLFRGDFDPILLTGQRTLAASIGLLAGVLHIVGAREVYHLRRPWLGWIALTFGVMTFGFYFIGPLMAITGMVLLGLAHREQEFLLHGADGDEDDVEAAPAAGAKPGKPAKRGKRRRPSAT